MSDVAEYEPRLKARYREEIRAKLKEKFAYANDMQIPRLDKVVINMGVGEAAQDSKKIQGALADLRAIAGQKPLATKAKNSIAGFKLREEQLIGAKVTLRRERMYEFIDRLPPVARPRGRDGRGLHGKSSDGRGNFAMGLKEHIVFPEIDYDKVEAIRGMDIIVCTTARTDEEAKALLAEFEFPFTN